MIVSCPDCSLEQPIDDFCASCGKPLKKLLDQKDQQISKRIKTTNYILMIMCLSLIALYSVYFILKKGPLKNLLNTSSQPIYKPLELKPLKIQKPKFIKTPVKKSLSAATIQEEAVLEDETSPETEPQPIPYEKVKSLYLLSSSKCLEDISQEKNLSVILDCSETLFKISNSSSFQTIDIKDSYSLSFIFKQQENIVGLKAKLETESFLYESEPYLENLTIDYTDAPLETSFKVWPVKTFLDLTDYPVSEKTMRSSILKQIGNFATQAASGEDLYYLGVFKKNKKKSLDL